MPSEIVRKALELSGFERLNPVQEAALSAGLLEGKSLVVAAPTASGKTLAAEMAALKTIKEGRKVVYIVPLRALASEKYEEFRGKYEQLGIKVAISIGDYDRSDPWLGSADLIVVTSEKLDSLLRHGMPWISSVGLVVADEIHLLDSPDRGPTLEVVLTRLRQVSNPAVLALSATINNYKELAEWLDANHVKSDWRPVRLYAGVCFDGAVDFQPKRKIMLERKEDPITELIDKTLSAGKQALVFINTRKGAETAAEKIGSHIKSMVSGQQLHELSEKTANALEHPTAQCRRLAKCILHGTAFHHAGLAGRQRGLIERAFREGIIKVICATPTLAAGLNLPAYRVIIRDLKRFSSFRGMDYIPILEIQQMSGRAGRPAWDTEGEAILMPKSETEARYAWDNYVRGEPEKIYSKLGVEPVLRTHVLALIASGTTSTRKGLMDFFFRTFYAHQYKDLTQIESILDKVISMLKDFGFIAADSDKTEHSVSNSPFKRGTELLASDSEELKPTRTGKRVSELYIDPLTAHHIIKHLESAGLPSSFSLFHLISNTIEMKPLISARRKDYDVLNSLLASEEKSLLQKPPNPWDIDFDEYLRSIKTAYMLQCWADEMGEDKILEDLGVTPGELRARLDIADWLLYSAQELALLLGLMPLLKPIRKARLRIKYGVKEELLPLVRLRGIGRARARKLYASNVKGLADLREIPLQRLSEIIGDKTAGQVKEQLGELEKETQSDNQLNLQDDVHENSKD